LFFSRFHQDLPPPNGLFEAAVSELAVLRKRLANFPAMTWPKFADYLRSRVNLLCTTEYMHQLVFQLQVGGEVCKTACCGVFFFLDAALLQFVHCVSV
jgi:hypothetical protein